MTSTSFRGPLAEPSSRRACRLKHPALIIRASSLHLCYTHSLRKRQRKTASDGSRQKTTTLFSRPSAHVRPPRNDRYNDEGFAIGDVQYPGPVLCYQSLVLRWGPGVASVRDVTVESLAAALLLRPRPELILLGTGAALQRLDPAVRQARGGYPSWLSSVPHYSLETLSPR